MAKEKEIFISHASEDKRAVALPLADALHQKGVEAWVDDQELTLGDALVQKIDEGLSRCRFGVVILSPSFLEKPWPMNELQALLAREEGGTKVLLPIRYQLSQQRLAAAAPLIAAKMNVAWEDGVGPVVDAILLAMGRARMASASGILVDFSHKQDQWSNLASSLKRGDRFDVVSRGLQAEAGLLESASVLIMPAPFHSRLERAEIDLIEHWVETGHGLLLMGCYGERHHGSNVSELAWRFDLHFHDDVVMPDGSTEDQARDQVFSVDPLLAVKIDVANMAHPILAGVGEVALLSAASLEVTRRESPELVVTSPPDALVMRPLGHILPDGSRPAIDSWKVDRQGSVPLVVARRWRSGRVVAIGTGKVWTLDHAGNARLVENALRWLAGR